MDADKLSIADVGFRGSHNVLDMPEKALPQDWPPFIKYAILFLGETCELQCFFNRPGYLRKPIFEKRGGFLSGLPYKEGRN